MRIGLLDAQGYVVNIMEWRDEEPVPETWGALTTYAQPCAIGGRVVDGVYTPPTTDEPVVPVPATISYRQLVLAMLLTGAIDATEAEAMALRAMPAFLEAIIASLPPQDQVAIRITLSTMTEADRSNPYVDMVAAAMGRSPAEVDDFFRLAGAL